MATVVLNEVSIKNKVNQALKKKRYQDFCYSAANLRFREAKNDLLENYDSDVITQEIKNGNTSENISNTIGYGNLFSFLGFDNGSEPAGDLREYLKENTTIENNPKFDTKNNRFTYKFPVYMPTMEEINSFTSMSHYTSFNQYTSRGWVEIIRGGLQTLGEYVYHEFFGDYSRSKTGLQDKRRESTRALSPTPNYLIGILQKFANRIRGK